MNDLVVKNDSSVRVFSVEEIEVIKSVIAPGLFDNELKLLIQVAQRTGLDPFARQIWCKASGEGKSRKFSIQATIDGFRIVAERSGKYRGQVGPFWCGDDGKWVDVWLEKRPPLAARIGVLRSDFQEPLWAVARFDSYAQRSFNGDLSHTWNKMPDLLISKCAEALALRRAFPHDLSGIYSPEEMAQAALETEVEPISQENYQDFMRRSAVREIASPSGEDEIAAAFSEASNSATTSDLSGLEMTTAMELAKSKSFSGQRMSVSNLVQSMAEVKKTRTEKPNLDLPEGDYKIRFGKHLGKTLKEIPVNTLRFMIDDWYPKLERPSGSVKEFYEAGCTYLNAINGNPKPTASETNLNDELPF